MELPAAACSIGVSLNAFTAASLSVDDTLKTPTSEQIAGWRLRPILARAQRFSPHNKCHAAFLSTRQN